jgi:hypothetical protein
MDDRLLRFGFFGRREVPLRQSGNGLECGTDMDGILVSQSWHLVEGLTSGAEDNIRFEFTAENRSDRERIVGFRFLLDTMNGPLDSAPFFVPNLGMIDREGPLPEVPEFVFVLDELMEPYNPYQIVFRHPGLSAPDRVVLVNPERITPSVWMLEEFGDSFQYGGKLGLTDTAVALYWDEAVLKPGEVRTGSFEIGVLKSVVFRGEVLDLSVVVPRESSGEVCLLVKNKDEFRTIQKLECKFLLPEGSELGGARDAVVSEMLSPRSIHFIRKLLDVSGAGPGNHPFKIRGVGILDRDVTVSEIVAEYPVIVR